MLKVGVSLLKLLLVQNSHIQIINIWSNFYIPELELKIIKLS